MSLQLTQESAFNLQLSGSTGTFRVGESGNAKHSHEVRFLLTHVGLDLEVTQNQTLLRHLAPVREIFRFEDLEFDEIMQRDIDDARVSHELIPYLLDNQAPDLVKLFPPVVIVLLPTQVDAQRPDELYPTIFTETIPEEPGKPGRRTITSGTVGKEVFQFEQPIFNEKAQEHDLVKLRIDMNKSQLVIVDGQHRAMALLALFRNLKQDWSDANRAPYKHYYAEWTQKYISQFNIEQVNLPLMICTIPSLNANYEGEYNLKRAARSIFLTLNKTARKVSDSRNRLLDDNDLISHFMRDCLSVVKDRQLDSQGSLQIFNVELDQTSNRTAIQASVAITGVNHLYYIIEHMMLDNGTINGVKKRKGVFTNRKDLGVFLTLKRLKAHDLLGDDLANSIDRERFPLSAANALGKQFMLDYGHPLQRILDQFEPFRCHNEACLTVRQELEAKSDTRMLSILFEGQGSGRVFDEHRKKLDNKLEDGRFSSVDVPQIRAVQKDLQDTAKRRGKTEESLRQYRGVEYFSRISGKTKLYDDDNQLVSPVRMWLNDMYAKVFSTVAFQSAIVCGFIHATENVSGRLTNHENDLDIEAELSNYLQCLSELFRPTTLPRLKRVIAVFDGEVIGDVPREWKTVESKTSFRNVVYRGEMQPDQWPVYRAILLEIWTPNDSALSEFIFSEREICRAQVFESVHKSYRLDFCRENSRPEDSLTAEEKREVLDAAFAAQIGLLKNLGVTDLPNKSAMKELVDAAPPSDNDEE